MHYAGKKDRKVYGDKNEPKELCGRIDLQNFESTTVNERVAKEAAIKAADESNKDLFNFTRLPVKVREPLKLKCAGFDHGSSPEMEEECEMENDESFERCSLFLMQHPQLEHSRWPGGDLPCSAQVCLQHLWGHW